MEKWRLIIDLQMNGIFNMAADHMLVENFNIGDLPQFRIYSWSKPTLTIGSNEKLDKKINSNFCKLNSIPIIRRLTGGKAVLHGFDLSYSIVGDYSDKRFRNGVIETYKFLSKGFFDFFTNLGLNPRFVLSSPKKKEQHLCFNENSFWEILVQGKKIIGNAQRVIGSSKGRVFLQHGSITISDPVPLMLSIFKHSKEPILRKNMICFEQLGIFPKLDFIDLEHLLESSLSKNFNISWSKNEWGDNELKKIYDLQKKYQDLSLLNK